ncbi:ABC transporter permease [Mucilaginibacter sp. OK098]|uniref:ABC transporter permease n=1 Tax=Mucilaginibacter sp. OK098 TaxID=1855297 RepID=UPI000919B4E9|nr:ABC transporter permease [Mucilaginibacter sp. OK098]SHN20730.1 ABC-type transport system, involved in lipoprotein release, permease component [Mucilaginibacter sp. OK098]
MIRNYLKIAWRNIIRHKAYSFINLSGLAIGMASSILILLWVQNELSYDRFHKNADQTYRITCDASGFKAAVNTAGMPAGLKAQMPEIKNTVRLSHLSSSLFEVGARKFEEKRVFYVDSTFFQVFSFQLVKGDPATALNRIDGVLLTQDMAKKYFGQEDAIGKVLRKDNGSNVVVTGVLANIPANSHLQFDFLLPMSSIVQSTDDLKNNTWSNFNFYSYVVLDKSFVPSSVAFLKFNQKMNAIYKAHQPDQKIIFQLQPLTAIHLAAPLQVDLEGHGNSQYVTIFFIVAILVLVVACINFMNLATARSARRAREIGLRKVSGAIRGQLILQFLSESVLISFFALLLALAMVYLFLPVFNNLADKQLAINFLDAKLWLSLLGIAALTGLISGSYPALFLSGFNPVKVLKGNMRSMGGNLTLRNTLVVIQFAVSILLLVGTFTIYNQLKFIQNRNPGFEKANLLYMPMNGDMWNKQQALKAELKRNPLTANFAIVNDLPINLIAGSLNVKWEGKDPKSQIVIPSMDVNEDFISVFKMKILKGRGFSSAFKTDSNNYVVNEKMLAVMGLKPDNAIGKPLSFNENKGYIIGVVKDFNFKPIQQAIEPLALKFNKYGGYIILRTQPKTTEATIKALEQISRSLNPAYPFKYDFLDQDLARMYKGEQKMGSIFNLFAGLAIFISCLGLYGLSAFMAEQRTREIGVRKVLGASLLNIVYLLSTGFTRLILIAIVIAIPLSWFAVNYWLEGFAYHINIGWAVFVLSSMAALIISWVTVSYESIKVAIVNPIKSLRSE